MARDEAGLHCAEPRQNTLKSPPSGRSSATAAGGARAHTVSERHALRASLESAHSFSRRNTRSRHFDWFNCWSASLAQASPVALAGGLAHGSSRPRRSRDPRVMPRPRERCAVVLQQCVSRRVDEPAAVTSRARVAAERERQPRTTERSYLDTPNDTCRAHVGTRQTSGKNWASSRTCPETAGDEFYSAGPRSAFLIERACGARSSMHAKLGHECSECGGVATRHGTTRHCRSRLGNLAGAQLTARTAWGIVSKYS